MNLLAGTSANTLLDRGVGLAGFYFYFWYFRR